ncbi:uncharacterized protein LOC142981751 [Anticarsia gemmatalis]|uniref:uncharacterized protein LOC142981751 n=1 Tax=Anticarsia gemmatalis TaxID=129554 RepID=UPI003F77113D
MSVFGYPSYPYNEPDDMGKQVFDQLVLSPNRGIQEPHVMPAPTGAPWNVQGIPWGLQSPPQLVQFTAQQSLEDRKLSSAIHCKRKSLDIEPVIPTKQRITEEKMAAHLNGLHISSEYKSHALANEDVMDINMEPSTSTASEKLKGHTIVLSEELKRMQDEPLLPAALIERWEKPHMSLVVWKPREHILGTLKDDEKKSKEEPKKRNGVLVQNLPTVDDVDM